MMYLRYALLAPISFAFNLFCWITAPAWGLLAAILKRDQLPSPFWYVHTHDAPVWGDGSDAVMPATFLGRWWRATRWIMRNPGYRFDAWLLGVADDQVFVIDQYETREVRPWDGGFAKMAWWHARDRNTGREYFAYRRDVPISGRFFLKLWFGWNYNNLNGWHPIKISFGPKRVKR